MQTSTLLLQEKWGVEIIEHVSTLTVQTAQKGEQLSKLKRENKTSSIKMVSMAISNLNNSVNIGEKMSTEQIFETAVTIITEYWMLKIDEVLNCFKMAKSGKFGKIFGLDQPTVMGFLNTYDTEVKGGYYDENAPTHTSRQREESNGTKHIALSIDELKQLKQ